MSSPSRPLSASRRCSAPKCRGAHAFALEDNILTGNCFGCGEGGDVITFLMKIDGLTFAEAVERLADKYGVHAAPRGRRRPRRAAQGAAAPAADRGQQGRPGVLRRALAIARSGRGAAVPGRARASTRPRRSSFGVGFAPRDGEALLRAPAAAGFRRRGGGRPRAGRGRPFGVRPLPRAAALADPRRQRRHDRLRRAADLRRRQDRGEVPQHPRDDDLQEEPGALRHRPGPPRHGPRRRRPWSSRATPT